MEQKNTKERKHSVEWLERKVAELRERVKQLEDKQRELKRLLRLKIGD